MAPIVFSDVMCFLEQDCFPGKRIRNGLFGLTKPGRGKLHAPQTKILEGGTKDEIPIFDRLFNGS